MDSKFLLNADLHRKAVGVPSSPAHYLESRLGLVAADGILDGAGHDMMDSRLAVCGGRTLEKDKLRCTFPNLEGLLESPVLLPSVKDFVPDRDQI